MDKIVIGIDESYENTGITVNKNNGEEIKVFNVYCDSLDNNTLKRQMIKEMLDKIVKHVKKNYAGSEVICIIERIRLQSKGFLNINYIKGIGALNALIVDIMYGYGIETFSVDTRAWKSAIVGTSKPMKNKYGLPAEKYPTILWNVKHGRKKDIIDYNVGKKKKGIIIKGDKKYTYDNDKSDSIAISFYGFLPVNKQKLEKEH